VYIDGETTESFLCMLILVGVSMRGDDSLKFFCFGDDMGRNVRPLIAIPALPPPPLP